MSIFHIGIIAVSALLLLGNERLIAAEANLDRTVEKLAASMLRECPELRGDERTSVARQRLVDEFEKHKVHHISSDYLKQIKRRKVDYDGFAWARIVELCEDGNFKDSKLQFLLKKAKAQKMRGEEHYVVSKLMAAYYEQEVEKRVDASRNSLSQLGKRYTEYLRQKGEAPSGLVDLQPDATKRCGVDPYTGTLGEWVYVGAGPAEIRGSNRYRVIAYSPFATGKGFAYRWVVYKGGQLGEWKNDSLSDAVEKMRLENRRLAQVRLEEANKVTSKKLKVKQKDVSKVAKATSKPAKKPKLKITIKELW